MLRKNTRANRTVTNNVAPERIRARIRGQAPNEMSCCSWRVARYLGGARRLIGAVPGALTVFSVRGLQRRVGMRSLTTSRMRIPANVTDSRSRVRWAGLIERDRSHPGYT